MKTKPWGNNVLIEVIRENDGVSRADGDEHLKSGKIVDVSFSKYHITASSFGELDHGLIGELQLKLQTGKIVRWEELADTGQTFKEDGKLYALIPWWRIISIEEDSNE